MIQRGRGNSHDHGFRMENQRGHQRTRRNLKCVFPSKRSQSEKATDCVFPAQIFRKKADLQRQRQGFEGLGEGRLHAWSTAGFQGREATYKTRKTRYGLYVGPHRRGEPHYQLGVWAQSDSVAIPVISCNKCASLTRRETKQGECVHLPVLPAWFFCQLNLL